jgi:hypothetical protein
LVGAAIRRLQNEARGVLTEKDMCAGMEVFVHECSWTGVACGWKWSEARRVLAQLCDEMRWFNRVCGLCQELAGDFQCFSLHELS